MKNIDRTCSLHEGASRARHLSTVNTAFQESLNTLMVMELKGKQPKINNITAVYLDSALLGYATGVDEMQGRLADDFSRTVAAFFHVDVEDSERIVVAPQKAIGGEPIERLQGRLGRVQGAVPLRA